MTMPEPIPMRLECGRCVLRPWAWDDLPALVRHANNPNVARHLRNRFPHPYTAADGTAWLARATGGTVRDWAIDVAGEAVGGVGLLPGSGSQADAAGEDETAAEIGYWLGETVWGQGIATAAVACLTQHVLTTLDYSRLFALVRLENVASCRVLEKAGYTREAVLQRDSRSDGLRVEMAVYHADARSFAR